MNFLQLILALFFTFSFTLAAPIPDSEANGLLHARDFDDSSSIFVKRLENDPTGMLFRRVDFDETEQLIARAGGLQRKKSTDDLHGQFKADGRLQRKPAANDLRGQYQQDGLPSRWSSTTQSGGSGQGKEPGIISKVVNKVKGLFGH